MNAPPLLPICLMCERFMSGSDSPTGHPVCEAFPEGIPSEILTDAWDHRRPLHNETILFKLGEGKEQALATWETAYVNEVVNRETERRAIEVAEIRPASDWVYTPDVMPWEEMSLPASDQSSNSGKSILDELYEQLMCDPWAVKRTDYSFTWWASATPIEIQVSTPRLLQNDPTIKISVEVPLVDSPSLADEDVVEVLAAESSELPIGAYVFDARKRRVSAFLTHYAHPGNHTIISGRLLVALMVILYREALDAVPDLVEKTGGRHITTPLPSGDIRKGVDDVVRSVDSWVYPIGLEPSRWGLDDFEQAYEWVMARGPYSDGASESGVCAEYPFTGFDPAILAVRRGATPEYNTSLVELTNWSHSHLGNGLRVRVMVPEFYTEPAEVANTLNKAERDELTGFPSWGGWTVVDDLVGHSLFLPNVIYRPMFLPSLMMYQGYRALWVREKHLSGRLTI